MRGHVQAASAAHVQRILRTLVIVTVAPSLSSNRPNGRLICHAAGLAPPAKFADPGAHASVPDPCTVPYTPIRFPFDPGAPCHVSVICVPLAVALTAPAAWFAVIAAARNPAAVASVSVLTSW